MRISSIGFTTVNFIGKKKHKKVSNPQVQKPHRSKGGGAQYDEAYENSYFNQKIMEQITRDDPYFKYSLKVAKEFSKYDEEKLKVINTETIKGALAAKNEDAACAGIKAANKFSADEIKKIFKHSDVTKYQLEALLTGVAPISAQEATVARLSNMIKKKDNQ